MKMLKPAFYGKLVIGLVLMLQVIALVAGVLIFVLSPTVELTFGWLLVVYGIGLVSCLSVVCSDSPSEYKITWLFFIAVLPVFGGLLYLLFANKTTDLKHRKKVRKIVEAQIGVSPDSSSRKMLAITYGDMAGLTNYVSKARGSGLYGNTSTTYFSSAEEGFPTLLEELSKAKHYIFIEFFIIAEGNMWAQILEILKLKAQEGVDVRVIYDDVGSLQTLPMGYAETLEKMGIKAFVFNPFKPILDIRMNNRDHRKIVVIDGHTAFSGGFNIADEYINLIERFGYWKDNMFMIKGPAAYGYTAMFLSTWKMRSDKEDVDLSAYRPEQFKDEIGGFPEGDGFLMPYGELPYDNQAVGEKIYISLIHKARRYVYITTPYLIITKQMEEALCYAAQEGVDVRLLTPHIPDKKAVFSLTRSYYGNLIKAGVKIYEFTPGFVHQKMFVIDDRIATVGTLNLDYRSLYLHLECGCIFVGSSSIYKMKQDFMDSISRSELIPLETWKKWRAKNNLAWIALRLFAPLL